MKLAAMVLAKISRSTVLVLFVMLASTLLIRFAPGYLSDAREMDPRFASGARTALAQESDRVSSLPSLVSAELVGWFHGDLGRSREYDVPVWELMKPRLALSVRLLLQSILLAWCLAGSTALLSSSRRRRSLLLQMPTALLLAVPASAMATLCLLSDFGGPLLVMTLLLAARDFKFMERMFSDAWHQAPVLQARAQGLSMQRILLAHVLPGTSAKLLALSTLSLVTALGAIVPIEVIFSVPGFGQLAWNAAMNRDLPVLLAVTVLMAIGVTLASLLSEDPAEWQAA